MSQLNCKCVMDGATFIKGWIELYFYNARCCILKNSIHLTFEPYYKCVDTHIQTHFCTSPNLLSPTFLWAQLMHCNLFYSLKHDPRPLDKRRIWRSVVWKVWVDLFLSLLHEPKQYVLQSRLRILAAAIAHEKGLVPKIFTQTEIYNSYCVWLAEVCWLAHFSL